MPVIAVAQVKGGVGKTTVAVNLAGELHRRGRSVMLFDADPQESAADWAEGGTLGFPVARHLWKFRTAALWMRRILKTPADAAVVDLPADLGDTFGAGLLVADLVLVPCGPSGLDLAAVARTLEHIAGRRRTSPEVDPLVMLVPTRIDLGTEEGQQIGDELARFGVPVAPGLPYDVAFVRAFAEGTTVARFAEGGAADAAIRALADAVAAALPGSAP